MSEQIIRHRGGGFDADDNPIEPEPDVTLTVRAVAPGATAEYVERGRNGDTVDYTIYHVPELDIVNDDEVTVRGRRFRVQVEQWKSPYTGRTGTVVLCSSGRG